MFFLLFAMHVSGTQLFTAIVMNKSAKPDIFSIFAVFIASSPIVMNGYYTFMTNIATKL